MKKTGTRILLLSGIAVIALSGITAWNVPGYAANEHGHAHDHEAEGGDENDGEHGHGEEAAEGTIVLTAAQIAAAGIRISDAGGRDLAREVIVPGKIVTAADRMAQIVPKAAGVVTEARKNLGDTVEKGEILALIESRDMAEAVADYLAAKRHEELARTTFNREKHLWEKKITAEQDYLNARNAHQEAKIRMDLSHQKLHTLGHDDDMIKAYDTADAADKLRFHEIRSPLSGRVIGRELTLGEYVDTAHTAFTIADLSVVWVETAISPSDLPFVREGQTAHITGNHKAQGKLAFVSPVIDPETRSAKAIIALDNQDGAWRPGAFVNASIVTSAQTAELIVPRDALQMIGGKPAVFVRIPQGFEKRDVTTGREDSRNVEIISGLKPGEPVAISNTFTLKAELGKSEAEHQH